MRLLLIAVLLAALLPPAAAFKPVPRAALSRRSAVGLVPAGLAALSSRSASAKEAPP